MCNSLIMVIMRNRDGYEYGSGMIKECFESKNSSTGCSLIAIKWSSYIN